MKGPKIWIVTRSIQNKNKKGGLTLEVGDVIKLGRVKLVVKKIQLEVEEEEHE